MSVITQLVGTVQTLLSTGLNSLANNALALSNAITLTSANYLRCELELYIASMGGTPTGNTAFCGWFIRTADGTNYSDGDASTTPARAPDFFFTIRAVSTAQRLVAFASVPPGTFKVLLKNNGTGQALASSGNTLSIKPITDQVT